MLTSADVLKNVILTSFPDGAGVSVSVPLPVELLDELEVSDELPEFPPLLPEQAASRPASKIVHRARKVMDLIDFKRSSPCLI